MPHTAAAITDRLAAELPAGAVVAPAPEASVTDWFGRRGRADAVVRARCLDEVSATLRICGQFGASVIPFGGNTGLVGGAISPAPGATVVLDLTGLSSCEVDPTAGTALVGAGVTIADLHRAAAQHGWTYGVDLASRDSATVGGTIATNAGGIHVCAYGTTRAQVLGLQCVMADGTVLDDLRGLPKDNTGYSWRDLVVGSEGTLAVITAARLALHRMPRQRVVIASGTDNLADAIALGRTLGERLRLLACEIVDHHSWHRAAADLALRDPLPGVTATTRYVVVTELDAGSATTEGDVVDLLTGVVDPSSATVLATDRRERFELWRVREEQASWWSQMAQRSQQELHKYDVTLPLARLDEGTDAVLALVTRDPQVSRAGVFGHVFEGSLHIQLVARGAADLDEQVLRLVSDMGGSLSAEHGIGRDKAPWLGLRRSAAELAAMRALKSAWDPTGILNPGVIFDR